jgi:hypothetical protein
MKKLFSINSIIAVLFCLATTVSFASVYDPSDLIPASPGENNALTITGDVFGDYKVDINVFYFDDSECLWVKYESHNAKKRYSITLNPETDYQIWYQAPAGHLKILYVDKGSAGVWDAEIDINFEDMKSIFAHMYQMGAPDDPFFGKSLMRYHISPADVPDSEEIISSMESSCTSTAQIE